MPSDDHQKSKCVRCVHCAVLTISDTRTPDTDASGACMKRFLEAHGHRIDRYDILPDEPARIADTVKHMCDDGECEAILLTGGTGLAARDTTYEAVAALLDKTLDGFGELFRNLSFEDIGPAAMLSRAVAGVRGRTLIYSMPGSTGAVQLAMTRLIIPTLGHAVALLAESVHAKRG